MINEEGLEAVWQRHARLSSALWAAGDVWALGDVVRLNVGDPASRSVAVTSLYAGGGAGDRLRDWCEKTAGLTLGIGLGRDPSSDWFRVGHMGHVNAPMLLGAIATIDAGLKALDIPHGQGAMDAAIAALNQPPAPA